MVGVDFTGPSHRHIHSGLGCEYTGERNKILLTGREGERETHTHTQRHTERMSVNKLVEEVSVKS
jgi:hypothetical protein